MTGHSALSDWRPPAKGAEQVEVHERDDRFIYGVTKHDDGSVTPWMRPRKDRQLGAAVTWDGVGKRWVRLHKEAILHG